MAELVNQRIEDMINELEQMRRTDLYNDEEIREIARKRKEFEYKIQRRVKSKEDFVHYIAFELAMLEDISLRRKQAKLVEKRHDIEYAISKRVNKIFKQFIYRFQNDIEVYFQYIKFCRSVGFDSAISGVIGQMLQNYGDKPKMWQMASKWESEEQNNIQNAREFLLKGIHRHPEADFLYLDLFKIELLLTYQAETDEDKDKQIKRADIVWRSATKNVPNVNFLFKLYELSLKYDIAEALSNEIRKEIWSRNGEKEVWSFIAKKELEGCHWDEIEGFVDADSPYDKNLNNFIGVYEEALLKFSDQKLCTKYIHELLGLDKSVCSDENKVKAVKNAWMFGHEHGLLSSDMYEFGIKILNLENQLSQKELIEIVDAATRKNPSVRYLWEQKLLLSMLFNEIINEDEKMLMSILKDASKVLKEDDMLHLWNLLLDNLQSSDILRNLYKKSQNCESVVLMAIKPKLLHKMYECCDLRCARQMYEDFIKSPPIQRELHTAMIDIEIAQDKPSLKQIRKCYECLVQHYGRDNVNVWMDYMKFETERGSAQLAPAIYRRAIAVLKKELVDEFIKAQTMSKIK